MKSTPTRIEGFKPVGGHIRAVERAVAILAVFSKSDPALNLKEVAARTDLDPATALRSVRTLLDSGLLEKHADGSYSLGFRILEMAEVCLSNLDVRKYARPVMRRIRDEIDETVLLMVRSGLDCVNIEHLESLQELRQTSSLGRRGPLHAGCSGKAILAFRPDEEIEAYISYAQLVKLSDTTITDQLRLRQELETTRRLGYAESENEKGMGAAGVAAPVFGYHGEVLAVLSLAVPLSRWPDIRESARELIVRGAQEVSRSIGYGRARSAS